MSKEPVPFRREDSIERRLSLPYTQGATLPPQYIFVLAHLIVWQGRACVRVRVRGVFA